MGKIDHYCFTCKYQDTDYLEEPCSSCKNFHLWKKGKNKKSLLWVLTIFKHDFKYSRDV